MEKIQDFLVQFHQNATWLERAMYCSKHDPRVTMVAATN